MVPNGGETLLIPVRDPSIVTEYSERNAKGPVEGRVCIFSSRCFVENRHTSRISIKFHSQLFASTSWLAQDFIVNPAKNRPRESDKTDRFLPGMGIGRCDYVHSTLHIGVRTSF